MKPLPLSLALAFACVACVSAADYTLHSWKKIQLSDQFWSEGATFADLNKDGHNDIISGPYWWEGPDFKKRHTFYPDTKTFKLKKDDGTEVAIPGFEGGLGKNNTYSDNFFAYTHDFNGDGYPDILILGFPGQDASWFENPGKAGLSSDAPWTRHKVWDVVDNESPTWGDLLGTGKPVIVCMSGGFVGYVQPNWEKPAEKWTFHPISPKGNYQRFTHGLGFGDVNGDGRMDIMEANGWWEQPASLAGDPVWKFHPFKFNGGGAQMFAYDVNGDGLPDVITSLAAHGFGLVWWEQLKERDANGEIQFKQHVIMNTRPEDNRYGVKFSQLHALDLVDMDGDGLKDIVTGKRFWAHGNHGDAEPDAPAVLYWFKLMRGKDGTVDWVPHLIDDNSGVGTQVLAGDINGDKLPDVVVGNKKGTFVHLHSVKNVSKEEWEKAQPKVLFADAGKQTIKAADVVTRTGAPNSSSANAADVKPNPPLPGNGVLPVGLDGKPLNTDFETGDLRDWTATGDAFKGQPIKGPISQNRKFGEGKVANHVGNFWIGGYEKFEDLPTGTLTSAPFKVTQPWAAFLIGGGGHAETRVELVAKDGGKVFFTARGQNSETMLPVVVDLAAQKDREIFIRIVDEHTGGWGHVNFDDFKFYKEKPAFAAVAAAAPAAQKPNPLTLDDVKFAGLSPEQAAKEMTLPPGFKATLFAGEPDVKQPIAFCIDDRGRLWVVENYTYPIRQPEGQGKDRIVVFEDTNGDGKFDKRTVFMEGLNMASGIEWGFGGIYVGAVPWLLHIPVKETDAGPQPAGEPVKLLEGFAWQDTHEMLNSFTWGPDGWLYGCHGVFTHSHVKVVGAPDSERQFINAGVWRYHPTKKRFEVFAEGTSNPWGVDFDERGQCIIEACVIPHLFHMIQGGRYQRQGGQHYAPSLDEAKRVAPGYFTQDFAKPGAQPINPFIYDDIKTIADHRHYLGATPHGGNARSDAAGGGHAHAGLMVYLGGSWPAEYRGQIFMNNIHGSRINMDVPEREGSGFVGKHGKDFILFNDRWSQIINLQSDQDGSVYLIDWYDKQQCHTRNPADHDRSNGRIFKITYGDTKTTKVDLGNASLMELIDALNKPSAWYYRHARRILQERGLDFKTKARLQLGMVEVLENNRSGNSEQERSKAAAEMLKMIWLMHSTGAFQENLLEGLLKGKEFGVRLLRHGDESVRAWTIQLLCEDKKPSSDALKEFERLAKEDPSPVVRLYLASACQRLTVEQRAPIVEALLAHAEDANDHNLPLMYWYAAEPVVGADPVKGALLLAKTKIPVIREFISKRMTAGKSVAAGGQ